MPFLAESKRQSQRGRCLHFASGARCNEIVSAHSIQRKGQLASIAEDGHVYRLSADLATLQRHGGLPQMKRLGINKASTFAGFCKHHDNSLFKPIDDLPLEPNKLQVALYAYRCICREFFVKENAVKVLDHMQRHHDLSEDRRALLRSSQVGHSLGLAGLMHHKTFFDQALSTSDYDQFEFVCFTSTAPCVLQLSGQMYPDYDFAGRPLQNLASLAPPLNLITFFTAPTTKGWAMCFAWHSSSNSTCIPLMQSLADRTADGKRIEDALMRLALICENHAFRISWWDNLGESAKAAAMERMLLGAHPHIPVFQNYLATGCEGIASWQYEYVHTTLSTAA